MHQLDPWNPNPAGQTFHAPSECHYMCSYHVADQIQNLKSTTNAPPAAANAAANAAAAATTAAAGEDGLGESIQYLQQLTEQLQAGEAEAVELVTQGLLVGYVEAVGRATAAVTPPVREIPVSDRDTIPRW